MGPITIRTAISAALFLTTFAIWAIPMDLTAQAPDLIQRQARIDRAIGITEQILGSLSGQQRLARPSAPPNQCLSSDAAWRSCLQDIQRDSALVTDPTHARRAQDQLAFLAGRNASLRSRDVQQDVQALRDVLAALQDEKQKIMQQINQQDRTRRPTR